jgi:hypothetical protein
MTIFKKFYIRLPHFILIGQKTWSPWAILVSHWLKFKKSSLKLGDTMNCYFVGMMYGRSCTKFPPTRNKNCLWHPCLKTDQDKMYNLYRGPSIDASYQVSVYLAKWFKRKRFLEID